MLIADQGSWKTCSWWWRILYNYGCHSKIRGAFKRAFWGQSIKTILEINNGNGWGPYPEIISNAIVDWGFEINLQNFLMDQSKDVSFVTGLPTLKFIFNFVTMENSKLLRGCIDSTKKPMVFCSSNQTTFLEHLDELQKGELQNSFHLWLLCLKWSRFLYRIPFLQATHEICTWV